MRLKQHTDDSLRHSLVLAPYLVIPCDDAGVLAVWMNPLQLRPSLPGAILGLGGLLFPSEPGSAGVELPL